MKLLSGIYHSFPVQIFITHLKKNQILLLLWGLLFFTVTQNLGNQLGIPYLFLDPEYMDKVGWQSMLIMGISLAIFTMGFFLTSFILDSYRFHFINAIKRPFAVYCLNNALIPLSFIITYLINFYIFQYNSGFQSINSIILQQSTFLGGYIATLALSFFYFRLTNKDIFKMVASNVEQQLKKTRITRVNVMSRYNQTRAREHHIDTYLDLGLNIRPVQDHMQYDREAALKAFDHNHVNAVIFEIISILIILLLSIFNDNPYFQIPAAASATLLFSIFVMATGAFSYWLRGWSISALILLLILYNFLAKTEVIHSRYAAFGLNYDTTKAEYSLKNIHKLSNDQNYLHDYNQTINILENWREKFPKDSSEKPKMIFICTSGGGQRAAAWTMHTLQYVDSTLNGRFMKNTMLITGASGGLIGASYYRELYLRQQQGQNIQLYKNKYFRNISKDILNPTVFSLAVNDIFFRMQEFNYAGHSYLEGRGYAFEQELNRNTEEVMDKKLSAYKKPERKAKIPMMLIAPTIINDGRKLYISPQNVSYLISPALNNRTNLKDGVKGVEFLRLFKNQGAKNLRFLSALRMNATFPYITPNVELPSKPRMEIMDAGLTDNFGVNEALSFLYTFRKWISKHTSGVILCSIRDSEKKQEIEKIAQNTVYRKIFNPIGSLYSNWVNVQDFKNNQLIEYANGWFNGNFHNITFQYSPKQPKWKTSIKNKSSEQVKSKTSRERASLSWHLTTREKKSIKATIKAPRNQASLKRLKKILKKD